MKYTLKGTLLMENHIKSKEQVFSFAYCEFFLLQPTKIILHTPPTKKK